MDEETRFRTELTQSHLATLAVAELLGRHGLLVHVPAIRIRPSIEQRQYYGDHGDLEVLSADGRKRGEVKWRKLDFQDCKSFPYETVTMDRANKPTADYYFIVNRNLSHAAVVVTADTFEHWTKELSKDRDKPEYSPYYVYRCPKHLCIWAPMMRRATCAT